MVTLGIKWFGASLDFGYRAPGCLQVWGVDHSHRSYRVAEVYYTEKDLDWWAEAAVELWQQFGFLVGVADCAEPRSIEHLNDRMGKVMDRDGPRCWYPSDKSKGKQHGLNMVRWALLNRRAFLLADAFPRGKDPALLDRDLPTCTEEEIPSYVFKPTEGATDPEKVRKDEKPDPRCADHGCNAMEYWLTYLWRSDHTPREPELEFPKGSIGWEYEMDRILLGRKPRGGRL